MVKKRQIKTVHNLRWNKHAIVYMIENAAKKSKKFGLTILASEYSLMLT